MLSAQQKDLVLKYFLGVPEQELKVEIEREHFGEWKNVLSKMQECMRGKHLSLRTEKTYLAWVSRFSLFAADRDLRLVNSALVRDFLRSIE